VNNKSFTLAEIIIVVVIIGIMASFAIPGYQRTIERAHLSDARNNLLAIHAAEQAYFLEQQGFWPADGNAYATNDINTILHLSIIENGVGYKCAQGILVGQTYVCEAQRSTSSGFTMRATEQPISATNPQCTINCP